MTVVWAHRGASAYAPENTLSAFELALKQGAHGIELDVQLTSDGQLVVIHDETLDRTTDGSGWVGEHSLAELKALDAGVGWADYGGERIPMLAEVFDLVADSSMIINVELKNTEVAYRGLEEKVLALIDEFGLAERIWLSTFNHESLHGLRQSGVPMPLGLLSNDLMFEPWKYAAALGLQAYHPAAWAVRERSVVDESHALGLGVHVWTVDEPALLRRMADWGVDAVFTNTPDVALRVLG